MQSVIEYTYDQNGQILESITRDADGSISSRSKHVYDAQGRMTRKVEANRGYSTQWVEYTYDPDSGLLVKEQFCHENGNATQEKIVYKYTNTGKLMSRYVYDAEGKISADYSYSYDERDNMTRCEYSVGNTFWSETCEYDQQNRLIRKTVRRHSDDVIFPDVGTVTSTTVYTYLKDGRLDTETTYDQDGSIREAYCWTYQKNGSSCEVSGEDGTGTITYDQYGNELSYVVYDGIVGVEQRSSYVYTTMRVPQAFSD